MGFESLLIIVVVVEAVWIISSLFRGSEDDRRAALQRRPPVREGEPPNARQRPPATNVDRFLEEINRRRREAAERQAGTARTESATANRPRSLVPPRPDRQPSRRPVSAPVVVTATPVPATVVVRPTPTEGVRDKRRVQVEPVVVQLDTPADAPPAPVPAAQPFVPSTTTVAQPAKRVTSSTQTQGRRASPVLEQLLPLLRDRKNLPAALALNEILGPPLSRRSRRPRRAVL